MPGMHGEHEREMAEEMRSGRGPGRPKDPAKRAAILEAADRLMSERGYERMTMEAVAEMAGVSKMTVYSHFPHRMALFRAVIELGCERLTAALRTTEAGEKEGVDLEQTLVRFGCDFLAFILQPSAVAAAHELSAASVREPELGEAFYNAGPGHTLRILADRVATAASRGEMVVDDPLRAAEDLFSLWAGDQAVQLGLGIARAPTPEEIERRVRRGTKVFLRAYRP